MTLSRFALGFLLVWGTCIGANRADAHVTRWAVEERKPFQNGRTFGDVGAYEEITGRVHFAVDPAAERNRRVTDLALAPKNAQGLVTFSADFRMLAPANPEKISGILYYDVNNRGGSPLLNSDRYASILMNQGHVLVSAGWIAELLPDPKRLRLYAPVAAGVTGLVRSEMSADQPAKRLGVQGGGHGGYEPTDEGIRTATLTRRLRADDAREPVDRKMFRIHVTKSEEPEALPRVEVELEGGFVPGWIYELIYEARNPVIQGLGLAGIRDLVSFFKYETGAENPLRDATGAPRIRKAVGFGVSQSGRCLRLFLYDGFNADERNRQVFDGMIPLVAGGGLGLFNHRFGSSTRTNTQHESNLYPCDIFPFTYGEERDPILNRTDGILNQAQRDGVVPKIMHIQTSGEYWHRSGSLVHTDPMGVRDAVIPENVRIYAIGGAQHGSGNGVPGVPGNGQLAANPTDYTPIVRGLFRAMDAWLNGNTPPPPSQYPRIADGTLTDRAPAATGWRPLPGINYPTVMQSPACTDNGPDFFTRRISTIHPPKILGQYHAKVPAVDPDNNDRGMILTPAVAVPTGTYTGWNLRSPKINAPAELLTNTGGYIPFPAIPNDRDPRRSLKERYPQFSEYQERYAKIIQSLIDQRLVIPEDRAHLLNLANKNRFDP